MVTDKENIVYAKQIGKKLRPILKLLDMEDWDIQVACKIGQRTKDDEKTLMEVDTDKSEYKKTKITVYEISKNVEDDLIHELLHCKIGIMTGAYKKAMTQYEALIGELILHDEERVVSDLQRTISKMRNRK